MAKEQYAVFGIDADAAIEKALEMLEVPDRTSVAGLAYTPRNKPNGRVLGYAVSASDDGKIWGEPIVKGTIDAGSVSEQRIVFPAPVTKKSIKFVVTDAVSAGGESLAAIGELDVLVR